MLVIPDKIAASLIFAVLPTVTLIAVAPEIPATNTVDGIVASNVAPVILTLRASPTVPMFHPVAPTSFTGRNVAPLGPYTEIESAVVYKRPPVTST
jgi:hypothetical protein